MNTKITYPITSLQVVFDHVWNTFVVDDRNKCSSSFFGCCYAPIASDPNTVGCAVGCLLPHEVKKEFDSYKTQISGGTIKGIYQANPTLYLKYFSEDLLNSLRSLQNIHDFYTEESTKCSFKNYMIEKLMQFAELNNLKIPNHG